MKTVIGLWGNLGTGKSTAAEHLTQAFGFQEVTFATPLKQLVGELFNWDAQTLYGPSTARNQPEPRGADDRYWRAIMDRHYARLAKTTELFRDAPSPVLQHAVNERLYDVLVGLSFLNERLTPRVALQRVGTEFGRALWDRVWVAATARVIDALGDRVVVSDVRFGQEAELVLSYHGQVWWIDASVRLAGNHPRFAHASEASFEAAEPFVTHVLNANGTKADTRQNLEQLLACHL